jgi:RNA polymerase sigma factor (sigma-70 family)
MVPSGFGIATVPTDDKQAFVAELSRKHGAHLRRFLARKLYAAEQDIPDLMQEIFLRIMRVRHHETIRSPQAYLFTVAFHVMYQYKLSVAQNPESVDIIDALSDSESYAEQDSSNLLDARQRLAEMERALKELPRNVQAAFVLCRRYGYSLEEIAKQLGVSRSMVKKYLKKAMGHFQQTFDDWSVSE